MTRKRPPYFDFVALTSLFLFFAPSIASAEIEDPALTALFSDAYDDPYIDWCREQLPNLQMCSAFDRSNLVEDPLIPDCWLVANANAKFRCREDGLRSALAEIGFVPADAAAAIAVAQLAASMSDGVVLTAEMTPGTIPPEVLSTITDPTIAETGSFYSAELYRYTRDDAAAWMNRPVGEWVYRMTVEVGANHFTMRSERVWSAGHRDRVRVAPD